MSCSQPSPSGGEAESVQICKRRSWPATMSGAAGRRKVFGIEGSIGGLFRKVVNLPRLAVHRGKADISRMAGELVPQIVINVAERRGSADEILTRWLTQAHQPQPTDIHKLWADPFRFRLGLLAQ